MQNSGKAPILVILHQEHSTPGRVGRLLAERGHRLDIRRPCLGESLPETLARHAGAVIFGGPMSVNDGEDFIRREIEWLAVPLTEEKPFLGLCLVLDVPVLYLWVTLASVALLPLLQLRRERLVRDLLRG